jgi:hypothetical protein
VTREDLLAERARLRAEYRALSGREWRGGKKVKAPADPGRDIVTAPPEPPPAPAPVVPPEPADGPGAGGPVDRGGPSSVRASARMSGGASGPGGRRGVEPLVPALSLDGVLEHPEQLAGLPPRCLVGLLRAARIVAANLDQAIALARLDGPAHNAPRAATAPEDQDQYLDPAAAAALLGVSVRFLRGRKLPGRVVLGPKRIVYSRKALLRFARARQE